MSLDSSTSYAAVDDAAVDDAFDEVEPPPRGALVLAGVDIAFALLLPILVAFGKYAAGDRGSSGYHPSALEAYGRPGHLLAELLSLTFIVYLFWPFALIPSVVSLVGVRVRSAPRIHRTLLAATVVLVLVLAASWLWYGGIWL